MKKFICVIVICLLSITFAACESNSNLPNNNLLNKNTHAVNINNEKTFNYYFSFSASNNYSSNYNFGTNSSSKYGTKSTSTITVTPKLTGFVEYSGYVELKPETESENKSVKVLKNRRINIEYWGTTTDIYDVNNESQQNDSTISFNNINYKFYSADIVVTYHHEGVSGNKNLSYDTIFMTKYNYKSYLAIDIENKTYTTTTYADNDRYHRNPIYTYHYYQVFTVTPSSQIKGYKEFNNIKLIFDNGIIIELDALGKATYKSEEYSTQKSIPKLSNIVGCIDFYPPAIYEY